MNLRQGHWIVRFLLGLVIIMAGFGVAPVPSYAKSSSSPRITKRIAINYREIHSGTIRSQKKNGQMQYYVRRRVYSYTEFRYYSGSKFVRNTTTSRRYLGITTSGPYKSWFEANRYNKTVIKTRSSYTSYL